MAKIVELRDQQDKKGQEVKALFDKADANGGEMSAEDVKKVKDLNKEITDLDKQIGDLEETANIRAAVEERQRKQAEAAAKNALPTGGGDDRNGKGKGEGRPNASDRYEEARKAVSLGRQLMTAEQTVDYLKGLMPSGTISEKTRIDSPAILVKAIITGLSDSSAGALVRTDYADIVNGAPFRQFTILDLVTKGETGSDVIEYPRLDGWTNAAAPVPEATATGDGSGAKPESSMVFSKQTALVRTIAHWLAVTTRSLEDAAQIRTWVDAFLESGLTEEVEDQVINGDGTGENFLGILNTPGLQQQAYDTGLLVTTRKARTKAAVTGRVRANAYAFNPLDWETFDLLLDGENRYYFGGPLQYGTARLWGIPVVEGEAMPQGTGLLGDWRYAVLWDRLMATIRLSNSHADFFIRNLVAILAELRAAFALVYPKAMVEIDLTP